MRLIVLAVITTLVAASSGTGQVILNQIDNFETDIGNWQNGAGLATVEAGGPGGGADHFLQLATNGATNGAGALLIGFNQNQWVGNYTSQGVSAIEMDLKNINYANGGAGMSVRLVFRTGTGSSNTPAYVSNAFLLPNDGVWHHAVFPLIAANFTALNAPPSFASVLAGGNADFRILHNPIVSEIGAATPPVAAQLGIDNIHAFAVPEPSSMIFATVAIIGATQSYRRRRRLLLANLPDWTTQFSMHQK